MHIKRESRHSRGDNHSNSLLKSKYFPKNVFPALIALFYCGSYIVQSKMFILSQDTTPSLGKRKVKTNEIIKQMYFLPRLTGYASFVFRVISKSVSFIIKGLWQRYCFFTNPKELSPLKRVVTMWKGLVAQILSDFFFFSAFFLLFCSDHTITTISDFFFPNKMKNFKIQFLLQSIIGSDMTCIHTCICISLYKQSQ